MEKYYFYFGKRFVPSHETEQQRKKEVNIIRNLLPKEEVIKKRVDDNLTSISYHKSYEEKDGAFIRHHIIQRNRRNIDEFDLKVYIWSPSIVEFIMRTNGYRLRNRKRKKLTSQLYKSIIKLYERVIP